MLKIIVTGKGGAGKTTLITTLVQLIGEKGHRVLTIDTDPSMNLAMSMGIPFSVIRTLGEDKKKIREILLRNCLDDEHDDEDEDDEDHTHPHSAADIDAILSTYLVQARKNVSVLVMGTIPYGGSGCICSSVALVKMITDRISSSSHAYDLLVVDSQAGSEILGRGFAIDFDYNLVVTEASPKSIEVARHVLKLAQDLNVRHQAVIINKVKSENEINLVLCELCLNKNRIFSIRYDEQVRVSDQKNLQLLDAAPNSGSVADIRKIAEFIT